MRSSPPENRIHWHAEQDCRRANRGMQTRARIVLQTITAAAAQKAAGPPGMPEFGKGAAVRVF